MNKTILASVIASTMGGTMWGSALFAEPTQPTKSNESIQSDLDYPTPSPSPSPSPSPKSSWAKDTSKWNGSLIVEGIYYNASSSDPDHEEADHDEEEHDEEEHDEEEHDEEEHHAHNAIAGFPQGAHDHGFQEGLHTGHIEAVVSGKLTENLYSRVTVGMLETEEDGLEMELEEAFIEPQGLGNGIGIRAGRFLSDVGYLSAKHNHEWDFADNALIYKGLFGAHTYDDGIQLSYLAPTDLYLKVGIELLKGDDFPAASSSKAFGVGTLFAKLGGDISTDHSWLMGLGHWRADDINGRKSDPHVHDGEEAKTVTPSFDIDSKITALNFTYKWAPNGNSKQRNFKFQTEYLQRDESGTLNMLRNDNSIKRALDYDGEQSGWYAQGIYQFRPQWRAGLRHDQLDSDNSLAGVESDHHVYEAANLGNNGLTPKRTSLMLDYSPREYSRWRLQYNRDETTAAKDNQWIAQFTHSFGSHGAHAF